MDFSQISERIVPEIHSVHRINAIERFIWIRNLITACPLYFDQTLRDRGAIVTLSHLHHSCRDVDARNESFGRLLCYPRERPAMAEANLKDPRPFPQFQQLEHASICGDGFRRHDSRDQTPEDP